MNDYITYINKEVKKDFQIIILEHIPSQIWKEERLENFYLVNNSEFRKGNALIPEKYL